MGDKVDMSLDDIIKLTKTNRRGRGGGGRGRGAGGGGGGGSGRGRMGARRGASPRGVSTRGGVQKRRSGSFGRPRRLNDDANWEHDMYEGGSGPRRNLGGGGGGAGGGGGRSQMSNVEARLLVSNLDFAVNDSDIYELFAECGQLKRGTINYDRSGRSLGTAEVVFEHRSDAIKAMKQYNKVPLDGLPMDIEMVGGEDRVAQNGGGFSARRMGGSGGFSRQRLDERPRRQGAGGRGQARGGGGRGRGGGGRGRGGRGDRKTPTAEELDAQLDAYTSKMEAE